MIVKWFPDGTYLEYAPGNFDSWCVYDVDAKTGLRSPPRDTHYFEFLLEYSRVFGANKIYYDFTLIYDYTGKVIDPRTLALIDSIATSYGNLQWSFNKVFTTMYMGMIAEEQKAYTRLGKRIKRLGVYKLLVENAGVQASANFMRGMRWREIDALCRERGF